MRDWGEPLIQQPYALWSAAFLKAYWITLRPYLFFLSGVSGAVGLAITGLAVGWFLSCFLAFFLTYGLGQALTDVFQTDTDAISSPYRPLTQGLITKKQVLGVSLTGLLGCGVVLGLANPWNLVLSSLAIVGLATYTPFKRRFWGGPMWNSWIVALLPAIGAHAGGGHPGTVFADFRLSLAMLSMFFTYAVFVLLGYHKDISADRQTGYMTIPVRFGWKASVMVSLVHCLLGLAASAYLLERIGLPDRFAGPSTLIAAGLWVLGAAALLLAHPLMLHVREEQLAHRSIAFVVRGYTLLHLGEAVALKPDLGLPALVYAALFEFVLFLRPERSQI